MNEECPNCSKDMKIITTEEYGYTVYWCEWCGSLRQVSTGDTRIDRLPEWIESKDSDYNDY